MLRQIQTPYFIDSPRFDGYMKDGCHTNDSWSGWHHAPLLYAETPRGPMDKFFVPKGCRARVLKMCRLNAKESLR